MGATGTLSVVGTGMRLGCQLTPEARARIEGADKLFLGVPDPTTMSWLQSLNPTAESLHDCYDEGKPRRATYDEMVARILAPVREGLDVCAAFYGHPGFFVTPSHEAMALARAEGHRALMLPGVSSLDCLSADLGVDLGLDGSQVFEATDLLLCRRRFDPRNKLILLQVGMIGVRTWERGEMWSRRGIQLLVEVLREDYPAEHVVTVYETYAPIVVDPRIEQVALRDLRGAAVTANSTLYVPPYGLAAPDPERAARLGLQLT